MRAESMSSKAFEALLRSERFPEPGAIGMRVLELSRFGKCSPVEFARAAEPDGELCSLLSELASCVRGPEDEAVDSTERAVAQLGIPIARIATLGFSLLAANRDGGCDALDYDAFWSRSLARAVATMVVSRVTGLGAPVEGFALGLLGEVGRLALANVRPERYAEILRNGESTPARELAEVERRHFGIDHGEVGAALLERLGVASSLANAIRRYQSLGSATSGGRIRCIDELLLVSDAIAEFCTGRTGSSTAVERSQAIDVEGLARRVGLDSKRFHQACSEIVLCWYDWLARLSLGPSKELAGSPAEEFALEESPEEVTAPAASPAVPEQGADEGRLRILAVDDDPVSLTLLERHLALAGHAVTIARSGDEALRRALHEPTQLVVADWQMPGLDGIELCKELRADPQGRKIYYLLLTGHGQVENAVRAFDAGVDDYVEKPFDPKILLARIKAGRRIIGLQEQVERDQATQRMQVAELQLLTRKLKLAAMTDVLTGLPNRRFAMKRLSHVWRESQDSRSPMSIVMIDIDEFKRVNDDHGHDAGDAVLRDTGRLLRSTLREKEDVCRLGGEEFLVICAGTEIESSLRLAERLRAAVECNVVRWGAYEGVVTLSLGVAQREEWMSASDDLLKLADEAVYLAKARGRNQVCVAPRQAATRLRRA